MKKFSLLEKHIILTSVKKWEEALKEDIKKGNESGKRHIWSEAFATMVINELYSKIHNHSKKDKNASRENS